METNLIDLHAHTNFSDGNLSPDKLISLAMTKGIKTLSITDHNTINAYHNINNKHDIEIIKGIELSAKVAKGKMHILGYNLDINNLQLINKLKELKDNSINSVISVIEQIKKDYQIVFTHEELKELLNANHNLSSVDIAKLCIKKGLVKNAQEAFKEYLTSASEKVRKYKIRITYKECIDLIRESNGIAVLAHPHTLKLSDEKLFKLLKQMKEVGLKGIEVYHSDHSLKQRKKYLDMAMKLDLLVSGGTDFHGKIAKPNIELGTGANNNILLEDLSILREIKRIKK